MAARGNGNSKCCPGFKEGRRRNGLVYTKHDPDCIVFQHVVRVVEKKGIKVATKVKGKKSKTTPEKKAVVVKKVAKKVEKAEPAARGNGARIGDPLLREFVKLPDDLKQDVLHWASWEPSEWAVAIAKELRMGFYDEWLHTVASAANERLTQLSRGTENSDILSGMHRALEIVRTLGLKQPHPSKDGEFLKKELGVTRSNFTDIIRTHYPAYREAIQQEQEAIAAEAAAEAAKKPTAVKKRKGTKPAASGTGKKKAAPKTATKKEAPKKKNAKKATAASGKKSAPKKSAKKSKK